jgi:hypothetical protein
MTSNRYNQDEGKDAQDQFKAKIMREGRDKKYLCFYVPPRFHENLQAGEYVTVVKTEEGLVVKPREEKSNSL